MFRKLLKNKKAQQTAEYALLISLVVAAVIAMQTYAQRSIQAKIKDASDYLADDPNQVDGDFDIFSTKQYEPYYLNSDYHVKRDDTTTKIQNTDVVRTVTDSKRTKTGSESSTFNVDDWAGGGVE